jgi:hypothetical protein
MIGRRGMRRAARDGELIAAAIWRILDDLDLDEQQRILVPTVVPRRLRELSRQLRRRP